MYKILKELFGYLNSSQRKSLYKLQVLVVLMALMQLVSVASILPFMTIVSDIEQLQKGGYIAEVYKLSGANSESQFIFWLGIGVLFSLLMATILSIITTWKLSLFANRLGVELADNLYAHYLNKDWLFHSSNSSASFTKKIASETVRLTHGILLPAVHCNSNIILVLFLSIGIFIFNPIVAIIGIAIFSISYILIFKAISLILLRNGRSVSEMYEVRFRLMNEGFGGIKDILLLDKKRNFIEQFKQAGVLFATSQGINAALAHAPRYFMELVAFGSMISLVLFFFIMQNGNSASILPILSVYAVSGMKLLPAFQQIFAAVSSIKSNIGAFESIQHDVAEAIYNKSILPTSHKGLLYPKNQILVEDVSFIYQGKEHPVLNNLNLSIPANSTIGIVGPSGSGKSTLIDVLLGLIEPQKGHLKIDNELIGFHNRRLWQNSIGFVAQNIFLTEGTIAENIAFGISEDEVNLGQVNDALKLANLDSLVKSLKNGINTKVGERGVQLSGGQRQRIGIARALYHKAKVLVFDEATSSLDGLSEKAVMEAIHKFNGKKTIIMIAHRLKTIENCDLIFFLDNGIIKDYGTYDELIKKSSKFKMMSENA
jgi:HlyD family secretion protein